QPPPEPPAARDAYARPQPSVPAPGTHSTRNSHRGTRRDTVGELARPAPPCRPVRMPPRHTTPLRARTRSLRHYGHSGFRPRARGGESAATAAGPPARAPCRARAKTVQLRNRGGHRQRERRDRREGRGASAERGWSGPRVRRSPSGPASPACATRSCSHRRGRCADGGRPSHAPITAGSLAGASLVNVRLARTPASAFSASGRAGSLNPLQSAHAYALLGVAQYLAVQGADAAAGSNGRSHLEAERGAVAGASAAVLTYLFPGSTQSFEDLVTAQASAGPGQPHPWFARGEAIGRAVGAGIVTRARSDGFGRPINPAPPIGPGYWTTNATGLPVAGGDMPGVTPWFLTSANQFRPDPPPASGSAEFLAALAEIRAISDDRTATQIQTAAYWALNAGTVTAAGFWLQVATDDINAHGLSEREAT